MDEKQALVPRLRFPEFRDVGEWKEKSLGDCLDYIQPTKYLVSSTDYDDKYPTPVLTAGKTFILGYTNETKGIFKKGLPVIIFDDFTTASKFVDFPFKAKSSAMKILLAKEGAAIKFIYEAMQLIRYEVGVHERHWISIFSKLPVPVPACFEEQQKIADCLSSLDALIAAQAERIDALKTHKKGLMQQLFPREGETIPRLRFPEFREAGEWEPKFLGAICDNISSGKDKSDSEGLYDLYGSTGIIGKTANGSYSGVYILVARVGANAGALTKSEGTFGVTDNTLVLHLKDLEMINFVYFWLDRVGLNKLVFGSGQPLVTGKQLKELELCFPSHKEQEEIANCLLSLDDLIVTHTEKLDALKNHKQGLIQQLFPIVEGAAS